MHGFNPYIIATFFKMIVTTKEYFTNVTLIFQSHPGANGEPGLPGLVGCKKQRGQLGVPELRGLEGVCWSLVTAIQMFLII